MIALRTNLTALRLRCEPVCLSVCVCTYVCASVIGTAVMIYVYKTVNLWDTENWDVHKMMNDQTNKLLNYRPCGNTYLMAMLWDPRKYG